MAHSNQARKRSRQATARNLHNREVKSAYRSAIKSLLRTVADKKKDDAAKQLRDVEKQVDKAAKRRIIHVNTASRLKSRLKTKVASIA